MCRHIQPVGLCQHKLVNKFHYEPRDPRRCARARLTSNKLRGTGEGAVRCEPPEVVEEYPRAVCAEPACWINTMLQQPEGWLCCQCLSHARPGRKRCPDRWCRHLACMRCEPHSTINSRY